MSKWNSMKKTSILKWFVDINGNNIKIDFALDVELKWDRESTCTAKQTHTHNTTNCVVNIAQSEHIYILHVHQESSKHVAFDGIQLKRFVIFVDFGLKIGLPCAMHAQCMYCTQLYNGKKNNRWTKPKCTRERVRKKEK